jgi:hypothetical protein
LSRLLEAVRAENLKGIRTTIIYGLIIVGAHVSLFLDKLSQERYVDLMIWSFGLYVGAKTLYKGAEIMQEKKNGAKSIP